jgi:hypothetical protein
MCIYDPETKEQSTERRHIGSPHPKKLLSKVLAPVFWDEDGILLVDYLNHHDKVLLALLNKLKQQLVSKR